jgi:hypothetical protein
MSLYQGRDCICRNCGKVYCDMKSLADYTGYCTQRCMKQKAKSFGYSESKAKAAKNLYSRMRISLHGYLKRNNALGSVYATNDTQGSKTSGSDSPSI